MRLIIKYKEFDMTCVKAICTVLRLSKFLKLVIVSFICAIYKITLCYKDNRVKYAKNSLKRLVLDKTKVNFLKQNYLMLYSFNLWEKSWEIICKKLAKPQKMNHRSTDWWIYLPMLYKKHAIVIQFWPKHR